MTMSANPGRIEAWVYRHASWLVALLIVIVIPLSAVTGWLVIDEVQQGKKLRGVSVAGPCRAFGIQNDECQRQARKIFAACYIQQHECWDKYGLPRRRVPDRITPKYGGEVSETSDTLEGGDAFQPGSTGHQQPGPRGGGAGGSQPPQGGQPHEPQGGNGGAAEPASSASSERGAEPSGKPTGATTPPRTLPEQATDALEEVTGTVTDAADKATDDVGETVDETCEHLPPALCAN